MGSSNCDSLEACYKDGDGDGFGTNEADGDEAIDTIQVSIWIVMMR